jgi:hypothetical protein
VRRVPRGTWSRVPWTPRPHILHSPPVGEALIHRHAWPDLHATSRVVAAGGADEANQRLALDHSVPSEWSFPQIALGGGIQAQKRCYGPRIVRLLLMRDADKAETLGEDERPALSASTSATIAYFPRGPFRTHG